MRDGHYGAQGEGRGHDQTDHGGHEVYGNRAPWESHAVLILDIGGCFLPDSCAVALDSGCPKRHLPPSGSIPTAWVPLS